MMATGQRSRPSHEAAQGQHLLDMTREGLVELWGADDYDRSVELVVVD